MQNPVIGKLLSQIESDKNDKTIQKQIEGAPSIKDLTVAERLECLKQFNNNNNDDDDVPPALPPTPCLLHHLLMTHYCQSMMKKAILKLKIRYKISSW